MTKARTTMMTEIVTPYGQMFEGPTEMVVVTAKDGEIGILPGHAPVFLALKPGEIRLEINKKMRVLAATNGYAEIGPRTIIIIVSAAEWVEQIDVDRAREAIERSEKRLNDPRTAEVDKKHARHAIERAKVRLKLFAKYPDQSA